METEPSDGTATGTPILFRWCSPAAVGQKCPVWADGSIPCLKPLPVEPPRHED